MAVDPVLNNNQGALGENEAQYQKKWEAMRRGLRSARLTISQLKDGQKKEGEKPKAGESLFSPKKEKSAGSKNLSLEISGRIKTKKEKGGEEEKQEMPPPEQEKGEAQEQEAEEMPGPEEEGERGADGENEQDIAEAQAQSEAQAAEGQDRENDYRQRLKAKTKEAAKKKAKEQAVKAAKQAAAKAGKFVLKQIAAACVAVAGSVGWIGLLVFLAIIVIAALLAYVYSSCEQNALSQGICTMFGLTGSGEGNFGSQGAPLGPAGANIEDLLAPTVNARQVQDADPQLSALILCVNNAYPAAVNGWWITSISDNNLVANVSECQGANYHQPPCQHGRNSCHYGGTSCQASVAFDAQPVALASRSDFTNSIYTNLVQATSACAPPSGRSYIDETVLRNHVHFSILNVECGCGDSN